MLSVLCRKCQVFQTGEVSEMVENECCEVCGKELKGKFTFVSCKFFEYHPIEECGECCYPVGHTCLKKIPKEFHMRTITAEEHRKEVEEWRAKYMGGD